MICPAEKCHRELFWKPVLLDEIEPNRVLIVEIALLPFPLFPGSLPCIGLTSEFVP